MRAVLPPHPVSNEKNSAIIQALAIPVYRHDAVRLEPPGDFAGLIESKGEGWAMKKIASHRLVRQPPLAAGQLWRMAEGNLQVGMVGKLLVHYKLGKPNAVRVPNSCNCIKTIEKYLKTKKAVLV
jgi:hypothetical protein